MGDEVQEPVKFHIGWVLLEAALASLAIYCLLGPVVFGVRSAQDANDSARAAVFVMIGIGLSMHALHVIHRFVRGIRARCSTKGDGR